MGTMNGKETKAMVYQICTIENHASITYFIEADSVQNALRCFANVRPTFSGTISSATETSAELVPAGNRIYSMWAR